MQEKMKGRIGAGQTRLAGRVEEADKEGKGVSQDGNKGEAHGGGSKDLRSWEVSEGHEAMGCSGNAGEEKRGEETKTVRGGGKKAWKKAGKEEKGRSNPEKGKWRGDSVTKDAPKEGRWTLQAEGIRHSLDTGDFTGSVPA